MTVLTNYRKGLLLNDLSQRNVQLLSLSIVHLKPETASCHDPGGTFISSPITCPKIGKLFQKAFWMPLEWGWANLEPVQGNK